MRFWAASNGADGLAAFDAFSAKSRKYDPGSTRDRWAGITKSPPTMYNEESLLKVVRGIDPGFPDPRTLHGAATAAALLSGQGANTTAAGQPAAQFPPLQTGAEFKASLVLKRPLIREWDLKPGNLYSLTAPTGGAKTAIALAEAYRLAREGKRVVYLAGENADDIRARAVLMEAKLELEDTPQSLRFVADTFDLRKGFEHVCQEVEYIGGADIIYVDTSPAFQSASGGEDENNNNEQIAWARHLRKLTRLEGNPATLALCHPTKWPHSITDCLPRGGGAFLAEVDGNYVVWPEASDPANLVRYFKLTWAGKFRGHFAPLVYRTEVTTCDGLRDEDGNPVNSVWAERVSDTDVESAKAAEVSDENALLAAMATYPNESFSAWADRLGWPHKSRVERSKDKLVVAKLAEQPRGSKHYRLTSKGEKAASELRGNGGFPQFRTAGYELAEEIMSRKTMCVATGREASIGGQKPCDDCRPNPGTSQN
jgi:AAA domain